MKALSCSISHLGYHPSSCCFLVLELGIESLTTLTALLCSLPLSLRCFVWVVLLDGLLWLAGWVGFRRGGGGLGFAGLTGVGCGVSLVVGPCGWVLRYRSMGIFLIFPSFLRC